MSSPGDRDAAPRARPAVAWIAGAALALLAAVHVVRHGGDLEVYWRAARRFLQGAPLYPATDGLRTYRYAPGAALLFAPLAPLPLFAARVAWYAVMVAIGTAVVGGLARRSPSAGGGAVVLVAMLGVVRPFVDEFHYAQANVAVLGLVLAAFVAEDRGRDALAGLLIAVAIGLKLGPLLFAADLLLRRRWRALGGVAAGLAALALLPVATYGVSGAVRVHLEWFRSLQVATPGLLLHGGNQSLFAMAARAGLPGWVAAAAAASVIAWALSTRWPEPRRSLLLLCLALAAPFGWFWNFVCALPAMHLVASSGRRAAWGVAAFGVASLVPLYDVGGPRLEHWVFERSLPGLCMCALFVLVASGRRAAGPRVNPSPAAH